LDFPAKIGQENSAVLHSVERPVLSIADNVFCFIPFLQKRVFFK